MTQYDMLQEDDDVGEDDTSYDMSQEEDEYDAIWHVDEDETCHKKKMDMTQGYVTRRWDMS